MNSLYELTTIPVWPSMTLFIIQVVTTVFSLIGLGAFIVEKKYKLSYIASFILAMFYIFLLYKGGFYIPLFGPYFH